jgi:hypothetical protein
MNNQLRTTSCLGFLTVVEHAELGLLGGYLLLNTAGRPLEFHCTAPVKPNRTQEILYGASLRPFVFGEQIGRTLLAASKLTPVVVLTDCDAMLSLRDHTHLPVVPLGADDEIIRRYLPPEAEHLDLAEPFTRIREALDEAQRSARAA